MAAARETETQTSAARDPGREESGGAESVSKKTVTPRTDDALVIRTDFSDQGAWEAIVAAIKNPTPEGFLAYVELIDDPALQALTATQLLSLVPKSYLIEHSFLMIVDVVTITEPEHPVLVVNLPEADDEADAEADEPEEGERVLEFRAVLTAIQSIENNLSIANMDFEDFAEAVDADGVFRGFQKPDLVGSPACPSPLPRSSF